MTHPHHIHTYEVVFTNSVDRSIHIYVMASTNLGAMELAKMQLDGWGSGNAVTNIAIRMLCE